MWKRSQSPLPIKVMRAKTAHKFMFIFFMNIDGMLLQHAITRGTTVNAEYHQKVFCFLVCLKNTRVLYLFIKLFKGHHVVFVNRKVIYRHIKDFFAISGYLTTPTACLSKEQTRGGSREFYIPPGQCNGYSCNGHASYDRFPRI